jgi:hypothetical protein
MLAKPPDSNSHGGPEESLGRPRTQQEVAGVCSWWRLVEEHRATEKPQVHFKSSGSEVFTGFKTISRRY